MELLAAISGATLVNVIRIGAWGVFGALTGLVLSRVVPNMRGHLAALFGGFGGLIGGVAFAALATVAGDTLGRLLGAAVIGAAVALAVGIVESVFRNFWLEIRRGENEVTIVNLGSQPVGVGSDVSKAIVYAPSAAPLSCQFVVRGRDVLRTDPSIDREAPVQVGYSEDFGGVRVTVCGGALTSDAKPQEAPRQNLSPRPRRASMGSVNEDSTDEPKVDPTVSTVHGQPSEGVSHGKPKAPVPRPRRR